jgi:hypothetical protein
MWLRILGMTPESPDDSEGHTEPLPEPLKPGEMLDASAESIARFIALERSRSAPPSGRRTSRTIIRPTKKPISEPTVLRDFSE